MERARTTENRARVAVIGGGAAGAAAASAAAAAGRDVLLVEGTFRLGGSVAAAMHRSLCGVYSQLPQSSMDTLNAGVQREVIAYLLRADPASVIPKQLGKAVVLEFPAIAYEAALLDQCTKPNIERVMNTSLAGVRRENDRITAIQVGSQWIDVKAIIDCTGSGAVMRMAGEDVMHPPDARRMLGGYSIRLSGIENDGEMLRLQIPYAIAKAVHAGALPPEARFTMFHPGPGPGEGICKLAVNPEHFADGQMPALAERIISNLRSQISGFTEVKIAETSPHALPRDGRRLKGIETVNEEDVLSGRQIGPDAVHAWWPIEQWDITTGPGYAYPPPGRHYDIPDEAMQSAVIKNLFAAGMCVSATAGAAASLRASGICLATGEAAGRIAARFA